MSTLRRPVEPHELEPLRALGQRLRALRLQAGISPGQLGRAGPVGSRQVERIEQGTRRTRRSTLDALVAVLLLARPDLGDREQLVADLVALAGPALAPESPYADKTAGRRDGKRDRRERQARMDALCRELGLRVQRRDTA